MTSSGCWQCMHFSYSCPGLSCSIHNKFRLDNCTYPPTFLIILRTVSTLWWQVQAESSHAHLYSYPGLYRRIDDKFRLKARMHIYIRTQDCINALMTSPGWKLACTFIFVPRTVSTHWWQFQAESLHAHLYSYPGLYQRIDDKSRLKACMHIYIRTQDCIDALMTSSGWSMRSYGRPLFMGML
jgi:hypothetical protein